MHTDRIPPRPDFRSPAFLRQHALWIMAFYDGRAVDPSGGMFHHFLDDGTVFDAATRHLVSATRFVVAHANAWRLTQEPQYLQRCAHALAFVERGFGDAVHGGFHWVIEWVPDGTGDTGSGGQRRVLDATRHMYGLAFVMLAAAHAHAVGIDGANGLLERTFDLAERRFYEPAAGLYADDATPDWRLSTYRGQNANMHACEAMIAAHAATGEARYLDRAESLAQRVTLGLAERGAADRPHPEAGNPVDIWEHYHAGWSPDWEHNRRDRSNIFRPWGYQPGHFTEWAKLLCQLDRHLPAAWHLPRAVALFERAASTSWDAEHGGLFYGFAPDGSVCDDQKYHWVQAESLAAAACLAVASDDAGNAAGAAHHWAWYDRIWAYCWAHFVDHRHGAWLRILSRENVSLSDQKSPAGKVDYHDMGACVDVLNALAGTTQR
ncbi:AGE family epimerase/isomerase [soil metagenome]